MSRVTALPALRNRRTAAGSGRIAIFTNSSHTAPDFPNLFITFAVDISKGCLTIRLRLYPLNRIRVMPKPGCIIFQRIPLFSSLTFKSSDMKRFLLPIAAVALWRRRKHGERRNSGYRLPHRRRNERRDRRRRDTIRGVCHGSCRSPCKDKRSDHGSRRPGRPEDSVRMYRLQEIEVTATRASAARRSPIPTFRTK